VAGGGQITGLLIAGGHAGQSKSGREANPEPLERGTAAAARSALDERAYAAATHRGAGSAMGAAG
jgi:hypothetical protein